DEVLAALPEYHGVSTELGRIDLALRLGEGNAEEHLRQKALLAIRIEELGGDAVRARAATILAGLGFDEGDLQRPLSTLSGGWHMRVKLARLLMARPELMLLDEPTNHLDLPSIIWFENYLKSFDGAYVIVAHDREFLNRTVDRVIEVDRGTLYQYSGNYDLYRRRKAEAEEHRLKAFRLQQARLRELDDFISRNRARKDRASQVQSRLKMLEKMERIEAPRTTRGIDFQFAQPERSGGSVVQLLSIHKSYGEKRVFGGVDLSLSRGEKSALVGINGMGKSTLLKIAAGHLPFDRGERNMGHNVSVGYFAQHQLEALSPLRTVLEEMYTVVRDESLSTVRSLLGAFLFSGDDVEKKISVLSGGEKSRLALAKLLLRPANLLIMDEPTNHLDIDSREVLEEALKQYSGTLLFSSHDRRFIDAIASGVVEVERGGLTPYAGNYSYYEYKKREESRARADEASSLPAAATGAGNGPATAERTVRDDRKERKRREAELRSELYRRVRPLRDRVDALEGEISQLEQAIRDLENDLADPALYSTAPERVRDKGVALARNRRELNEKMDLWELAVLEAENAEQDVRSEFDAADGVSPAD
ncbi:MAG: ABC-F family ATP-binding cassette domain-containing protein, partial [Deltaproteobacteria bacterium]|nr:ABC-F family ATP-binding cassette domain-containing protein [Deltaproteobacteria bacterium]